MSKINRLSVSMTIRPYEASDVDALIEVFRASVRYSVNEDYSESQRLAWAPDDIERSVWLSKRSKHPTWVALDKSDIVGFVDLGPNGHIDMLYVHSGFQRLGIATSLLQMAEKEARTRNIERLFTEASITARPVFEASGFSVLRQQTVSFNSQTFVNFYMQKPL